MMQVNGRLKQDLHLFRPQQLRVGLYQRLQIAVLMSKAQLALLSWRFQLSRMSIADPHFRTQLSHDLLDHVHTAVVPYSMQDRFRVAEHPLPPVVAIHPAAGLIRMDHRALDHFRLDGRKLVPGTPSGSAHDLVNPA
jgi:hypothetical protein